jgi:hypothetical protein
MKPYIIALVFLLIAVFEGVYFTSKLSKISKEKADLSQNLAATGDSLHTYQTTYGAVFANYAYVKSLNDSLKNVAFYKDKQIFIQQNTIASLEIKLKQSTTTVITSSDSIVGTTFYNTYKDSGLTAEIQDSVRFDRIAERVWKGYNIPKIKALISLLQTVGRDKTGLMYGSVQTLSPYVKVTSLRTVVDDKYVAPPPEKHYDNLMISSSLDSYTLGLGLMLRLSRWYLGGQYLLITDGQNSSSLFDKLRINVNYGVF